MRYSGTAGRWQSFQNRHFGSDKPFLGELVLVNTSMNSTLSRRNFLTIMGALSAATVGDRQIFASPFLRSGETTPNPAGVVRGNARFQVLSPSLVRMEYALAGHFIDAPSVAVLNRNWLKCDYTARDGDGWME